MNKEDRIKLSVYSSCMGTRTTIITNREDANQFVLDFKDGIAVTIDINGRINDCDGNLMTMSFKHSSIGAVEIMEVNKDF